MDEMSKFSDESIRSIVTRRQALKGVVGTALGISATYQSASIGSAMNPMANPGVALSSLSPQNAPNGAANALQVRFAENDVLLFKDYLSSELRRSLAFFRGDLVRDFIHVPVNTTSEHGSYESMPNIPENQAALSVNKARNDVVGYVDRFLELCETTSELLTREGGVYSQVLQRQYDAAIDAFEGIKVSPNTLQAALPLFVKALTTESIPYESHGSICNSNWRPPCNTFTEDHELPGWPDIALPAFLQEMLETVDFINRGIEYDFRRGVFRAECRYLQQEFDAALEEYENLFAHERFPELGETKHKFMAIKAATAFVAKGDALYRRSRSHDDDEWAAIAGAYDAAGRILDDYSVSAKNPLRAIIDRMIEVRLHQVSKRFNFLGFHDRYAPVTSADTISVLYDAAVERATTAKDAAGQWQIFREREEQEALQTIDLRLDENVARTSIRQAEESAGIAQDKYDGTRETQAYLNRRLNEASSFFGTGLNIRNVAAVAFVAAAAAAGGPGSAGLVFGLSSAAGVTSLINNNSERQKELSHQLRMAEVELGIAERERNIADLQRQIAVDSLAAAEEKLAILESPPFNRDAYHALANFYEELARRSLDEAIELGFLYERAVAFWTFREVPRVAFDLSGYVSGNTLENLGADERTAVLLRSAPDGLIAHLRRIAAVLKLGFLESEFQVFTTNNLSLRQRFPLEFKTGLLNNGTMHFAFSLRDIDKMTPGACQVRLRRLGVHVAGIVPATGYGGRLTHHGPGIVRDRVTTFGDPEAGILPAETLLPSDDQLEDVINSTSGGAAYGTAFGGIIPLSLEPDVAFLSMNNEYDVTEAVPDLPLTLFQGYSPAGPWSLTLTGLEPIRISDVYLRWTVVMQEPTPSQVERVLDLIDRDEIQPNDSSIPEEERPDGILVVSLGANRDANVWLDLERNGETTFEVESGWFPIEQQDLKVKSVVGRALERDGEQGAEGIAFELRGPGESSVADEMVTVSGGFTHDLGNDKGEGSTVELLEPEARFDLVGEWRVRMGDPADVAQLGDLQILIMYEFTHRGAERSDENG